MTTAAICLTHRVRAGLWALIIHPVSQTRERGLRHGPLHVQGCAASRRRAGSEANTWCRTQGESLIGVERWRVKEDTRHGMSFLTFS